MEAIHLGLLLMLCLGVHASSSEVLKRQKRNWIIDSFSIDEGYSGDFPYVLGSVKIEKDLTFFKIQGQGVNHYPKDILRIDDNTGQITVHRPVDFEEYQVLKLDFQALDRYSHVIDIRRGIEILIIDANDNAPLFERDVYNFNLPEATSQGTEVMKIKARDEDRSKKYNSFDLRIVSVHPEPSDLEFFLIQRGETGTISFKGYLNHEKAEKYTIIVEAKDHGEKRQLSSSCTVIIHIEDGNNHLPVITGQTGSGRVKEREENLNRLQVTEKDSKGQGDTDNNDVNKPPFFQPPKKQITQREDVEVGKYLATLTAGDPDVASSNTLVYKMGHDPANWLAVDPRTGNITTTKLIDRESTFVKDNVYTVTVWAVDNGQPPMTGTATLEIFIMDENDNAPSLAESSIDMCQSDGLSQANIKAVDLDEEPYGGPFIFKLQEKEKGRWRLDPTHGFSVNLVKEPTVHSGQYELLLEVFDLQGVSAVHNLLVTVCDCKDAVRPNCRLRKAASSSVGAGALGVVFLCLLPLAVLLLLFMCQCRGKDFQDIPAEGSQTLIKYNQEGGGSSSMSEPTLLLPPTNGLKMGSMQMSMEGNFMRGQSFYRSTGASSGMRNSMRETMGASAAMNNQHRRSVRGTGTERNGFSANQEHVIQDAMLLNVLNKMLSRHQAPGEELGDYAPHVYAEEGGPMTSCELDAISIPDISFDPDIDTDLASKFKTLASICMLLPDDVRPGL